MTTQHVTVTSDAELHRAVSEADWMDTLEVIIPTGHITHLGLEGDQETDIAITVTGDAVIDTTDDDMLIDAVTGRARIHCLAASVLHLGGSALIDAVGASSRRPRISLMDGSSRIVRAHAIIDTMTGQASIGVAEHLTACRLAGQAHVRVVRSGRVREAGPWATVGISDVPLPAPLTPLADDMARWAAWAGCGGPRDVTVSAPVHPDSGSSVPPVLTSLTGEPVHPDPHGAWVHPDGILLLPHPEPVGDEVQVMTRSDWLQLTATADGAALTTAAISIDDVHAGGAW